MPKIVASFHDEKLINFLKSPAKVNGYISVPNAWIIVKQGYAVPIIIKATPHIDVKHDLRFIGQIKLRTDINLPNEDFD